MVIVKIGAQAVVVVQHGSHAVKPEAVKMVLRHPEFQVAQQEVEYAGLAVVKALGTPGRMISLGPVVEELPGSAVEHIDSLGGILHRVGVDHVQQYPDPHGMGSIDQVFQVLGLTEPAGCGKEIRHLIPEAAVIGVLHDGHELNGIVAIVLDPG